MRMNSAEQLTEKLLRNDSGIAKLPKNELNQLVQESEPGLGMLHEQVQAAYCNKVYAILHP